MLKSEEIPSLSAFGGTISACLDLDHWCHWIRILIRNSARGSLYTVLYKVQCTVYSVQCTVYSVLYSVQCTVYSVQCTVYSVQCTVYSVQHLGYDLLELLLPAVHSHHHVQARQFLTAIINN
jgi:hypothetical protein